MSGVRAWAVGVATCTAWGGRGGEARKAGGGGHGSQRLIIFIDRKKVPDLVWRVHDASFGEIPIIYGYFVSNPEKYWPVKGYRIYVMCD